MDNHPQPPAVNINRVSKPGIARDIGRGCILNADGTTVEKDDQVPDQHGAVPVDKQSGRGHGSAPAERRSAIGSEPHDREEWF
jgi:hypothetical protein